eukprot:TRINITY_DN315_c0_g1_i1.p1 TRINITY_DN315_c0_g1~~TRINITY_DN315_c0_g1_i1.p1  ORF type:complete len:594 (+),score=130.12 TRINITY_DN315_c0_g1_i1:62-1843(+)
MACFKVLVLMTVISSPVTFAATPACANEKGMGYDDPEHPTPLFLADAAACQGACKGMFYCEHFTFYPKESGLGGCFLQGEKAKSKPLKGAISGPKSCNVTTAVPGATAAPAATSAPTTAPLATAAPAAAEVKTPTAVEPTTTTRATTSTIAEPAPTSAEDAAAQAVEKLGKQAPPGQQAVAAANAAASFAISEGKSKDATGEIAYDAAKQLLVDADTTNQIKVNDMASAVGAVYSNQFFNLTNQEAADRTQKDIKSFAKEIYDTPEAALAAVGAAGTSVSAATGKFPTAEKPGTVSVPAATTPQEPEAPSTTYTVAEPKVAVETTEAAEPTKAAEPTEVVDDTLNVSKAVSNRDINLPAEEPTKVVDDALDASKAVSSRDINLPDADKELENKSEGIPSWAWILIALAALLACLGCGYSCLGSSKDKKKKTKTKTAPKETTRDIENAPLLKGAQEAPVGSTSVYSAPVAAAAAGGVPTGSVAQGAVFNQGSPVYSTSARGFALPQGSPVSGSSMVMMPQAAPAYYSAAAPGVVSQAQPVMMPGGMSVARQGPAMAQTSVAGGSAAMDLFNRLDANGDGQLSAQEFAQLAAMRR